MDWIEQCQYEANNLTKDQRRKVLTELRTGKTIGETREKFGLTLAAVCGVVEMNIKINEYLSLNKESV